jgi:hypothetical protein
MQSIDTSAPLSPFIYWSQFFRVVYSLLYYYHRVSFPRHGTYKSKYNKRLLAGRILRWSEQRRRKKKSGP